MPAWREAMNLVECLAKRSLTDDQGKTKGGDVKRLVEIGESQLLGLFDKLPTRLAAARHGCFRSACDRPMNDHRTSPNIARLVKRSCWMQQAIARQSAILSFGAVGKIQAAAGAGG